MKKKMQKFAAAILSVAMLISMAAGCGGKKADEAGTTAGSETQAEKTEAAGETAAKETEKKESEELVELTYCVSGSAATAGFTLDPAIDYCGQASVTMGTCETLFVLDDETKEVICLLASDYEHTDDTTWTITIRDGITFSNGKALTAEACKSALDYIFANNTRLATMADIASIEADGQTLTIKTNDVVAIMPRILSEVNTLIFDTEGTEDYAKGLVGTGPYILESCDGEGNCELVKNENYWQGEPGADLVHTKTGLDAAAITLALQSGELDFANVQTSDLPLFEGNDQYQVSDYNSGRVYFLYLNPGFTFTQDAALREALTYEFDRDAILAGVYGGRGFVTNSIFPDWSSFYSGDIKQVDYDMDTAKKILTDAGYADSNGDGFLEKDGETVKLNITCYSGNSFPALSEVIQSILKDMGIDSEIVVSDAIAEDLASGEFNIATYAYNTLTMGDCYNYLEPVFRTGGSSNFTGFSSAEVDALLDELKVESDPEKRAEIAIEIQKYIYEADQHVFLMHIVRYQVAAKNVKNLTAQFGSDNANNSILWKITKE